MTSQAQKPEGSKSFSTKISLITGGWLCFFKREGICGMKVAIKTVFDVSTGVGHFEEFLYAAKKLV